MTTVCIYVIIVVRKRVLNLDGFKTLASIKKDIEDHVGHKVTLRASGGRRKVFINEGTIEKTYHSIFLIRLKNDTQRIVTYSYSDVLTNTVQIVYASWYLLGCIGYDIGYFKFRFIFGG